MKFWTKNKLVVPDAPTEGGHRLSAEPQKDPKPLTMHRFPTMGDVLAMLGITFLAQILIGTILLILTPGSLTDSNAMSEQLSGKWLVWGYLLSMTAALVGVLIYRYMRGGRGRWAHFSMRGLNPAVLVWAFVLIFAVGIILEPLLARLPEINLTLGRGFWTIIMLVVFAPVFEELLCRGVVLGSLRAKYGTIVAWVISSLFFGVLHMQPAQVVSATAIGLILGYVYLATNSLWAVMILHGLNNAVAYLMMSAGYENALLIDLVESRLLYLLIYLASLTLAIVSGYMMLRKLRQLKEEEKNRVAA